MFCLIDKQKERATIISGFSHSMPLGANLINTLGFCPLFIVVEAKMVV